MVTSRCPGPGSALQGKESAPPEGSVPLWEVQTPETLGMSIFELLWPSAVGRRRANVQNSGLGEARASRLGGFGSPWRAVEVPAGPAR